MWGTAGLVLTLAALAVLTWPIGTAVIVLLAWWLWQKS